MNETNLNKNSIHFTLTLEVQNVLRHRDGIDVRPYLGGTELGEVKSKFYLSCETCGLLCMRDLIFRFIITFRIIYSSDHVIYES